MIPTRVVVPPLALEEHRERLCRHVFGAADSYGAAWTARRADALQETYGRVRTTSRFQQLCTTIASRAALPFEVFVLGEGKFGKSTLLNALLGQELSAMGLLPKTRCFLRFRVAAEPDDRVAVYARLRGKEHDCLRGPLGPGVKSEIGDLTKHVVSGATADHVLAEDHARMRAGADGYAQAIFEIERAVFAPRAAALGDLRVVDTQGLNQIFPAELEGIVAEAGTASGQLERWFRSTPRGQHLDWEYRRCDAAIWLAHARRPASAITSVAMEYFARYGKETLVVVSNVDSIEDLDERERVLRTIADRLGLPRARLVPLNGRMALRAVLDDDSAAADASGFRILVERLRDICSAKAVMVRNIGQFNALMKTAREQEDAVEELRKSIHELVGSFRVEQKAVDECEASDQRLVAEVVERATAGELAAMLGRISSMRWNAGADEALAHIGTRVAQDAVASRVGDAIGGVARRAGEASEVLRKKKFSLPAFAADGAKDGVSRCVTISALPRQPSMPAASFALDLRDWFDALAETLFGFFYSDEKKRALALERQAKAASQCVAQWEHYGTRVRESAARAVAQVHECLRAALRETKSELERVEGKMLETSLAELTDALARDPAPNVFVEAVVAAFRSRYLGKGVPL